MITWSSDITWSPRIIYVLCSLRLYRFNTVNLIHSWSVLFAKWTDKWTDFNRSRFITGEMLKMTHNWWLTKIKYRIRPFTCLFSFRINSNVNSSDTRHHKSSYCHYICQHSVIICQQFWNYRGRLPECP